MKWSTFIRKDAEGKKVWESYAAQGYFEDFAGLSKWRVVNVIDAKCLESGTEAYSVEMEGGLLSYLKWQFNTRVLWKKRMPAVKTAEQPKRARKEKKQPADSVRERDPADCFAEPDVRSLQLTGKVIWSHVVCLT